MALGRILSRATRGFLDWAWSAVDGLLLLLMPFFSYVIDGCACFVSLGMAALGLVGSDGYGVLFFLSRLNLFIYCASA